MHIVPCTYFISWPPYSPWPRAVHANQLYISRFVGDDSGRPSETNGLFTRAVGVFSNKYANPSVQRDTDTTLTSAYDFFLHIPKCTASALWWCAHVCVFVSMCVMCVCICKYVCCVCV